MEPIISNDLPNGYDVADVEFRKQKSHQASHPDGNAESKENALEAAPTAASVHTQSESYPEGGTAAWLVVTGAWFALFSGMGTLNTLATWQAYVLEHQLKGYNEGTVGWIFSVYTFLTFFCGIYIGPIFDKYGPRWLIIAGGVCLVASFVLLSFCTQYWHFMLAFGVLSGLATSLLLTPSIASIGHWFKARRGFTTSIATSAGGLGGIIFPFMLTNLWDRIGYRWGTLVLALISVVTSIIGIILIKSRLPPAPNATAQPDFRIFKQIPFFLTTLGIFTLEFSLFIPLAYISTFAIAKGFSVAFAYQLLPILNTGSVIGRLLPGYYSDIIGAFNTCILATLLCFVSTICVWLPAGHTTAGIVIFAVLFGLGSGIGIAIAPVCISRMCKTQEYGRYYATAYMVVSFACLLGIPIAGNIVQAGGGSYVGLIITTGAVFLVSSALLIWAKLWQLGWAGWKTVY